MASPSSIALIGCGKMGGALLEAWVKASPTFSYLVIEPYGVNNPPQGVTVLKEADDRLKDCGVVVLAVKPQAMDDVCANLKPLVADDALILSIAAGRSIASFERSFGVEQPIVRTMPNLPASIGKGMTVAVANPHVTSAQREITSQLLGAAGAFTWVEDEKFMDVVTALSGSGPAYIFYMIETMTQAGIDAGLDPETAAILARQTVIGSAALVEASSETPATLREKVTSKAGTTEAGLAVLMDGRMQRIMIETIKAAANRSRELNPDSAPAVEPK